MLATAAEIQKLLRLSSAARVYELARRGLLPGVVRLGRQVRFDRRKVLEFVDRGGRSLPGGWRREERAKSVIRDDQEEPSR
jgi:predicted DNA-binding transcriptional regulator AlpA